MKKMKTTLSLSSREKIGRNPLKRRRNRSTSLSFLHKVFWVTEAPALHLEAVAIRLPTNSNPFAQLESEADQLAVADAEAPDTIQRHTYDFESLPSRLVASRSTVLKRYRERARICCTSVAGPPSSKLEVPPICSSYTSPCRNPIRVGGLVPTSKHRHDPHARPRSDAPRDD